MTIPDPAADPVSELVAVLRLENDALARNDFPAAAALLDRKREAARRLAEGETSGEAAVRREVAVLARENHRLLERAMAVQRDVIALVARAASGAGALSGRYARGGAPVRGTAGGVLVAHA